MRRIALVGFCFVALASAPSHAADPPKPQRTFPTASGLTDAAFSPDRRWLATAGGVLEKVGEVKLWDVTTGKEAHALAGHKDLVLAVAFSPDGRTLASAGWDRTVRLWDVATGKERPTLRGHTKQVWSVAFSPDGKRFATGSADGTAKLWDVATGKESASLKGAAAAVTFSPDGKTLAVGSDEGAVRLWDVATGQEKAALRGHTNRVTAAAFAPEGKTLATASWDAMLCLWDVPGGRLQAALDAHQGSLVALAFSPDGQALASACDYLRLVGRSGPRGSITRVEEGGEVIVWDTARGRRRLAFEPEPARLAYPDLVAVAFTADGKGLFTVNNDGAVRQWNLAELAGRARE